MGAYGKFWRQNSRYYGAQGKPAPARQMGGVINPAAAAETQVDPRDPNFRKVYLRGSEMRNLKRNQGYSGQLARQNLLHEWTHANQSDATLAGPNLETGAYRLSKAISRSDPQKRQAAYKNLSPWIRKGQFGLPYDQAEQARRSARHLRKFGPS